jgi:hypothetical protein
MEGTSIILFPKPGKPPHLVTSYRPISLLPVIGKVLERLLLPRLLDLCSDAIPRHQFGFRSQHSTIHQLHRLVDFIAEGLEKKKYTTGVFIDIASAFDKVWHEGLLVKMKALLPDSYYRLIRSFLENRLFEVRQGQTYSRLRIIGAGVPQGAVLSPLLYTIFTSDMPQSDETLTATFADDTAILGQSRKRDVATRKIQTQLNDTEIWLKRWRIKANPNKSVQVTFALRPGNCPPASLHNEAIQHSQKVKYLGIWIDRRLTFKHHLEAKRTQLDSRLKQLYPLLCPSSKLRIKQKLLLYKSLIKPIWSYGLQIFGVAALSNVNRIQRFQSKFLRLICGAPFYVSNWTLHSDLKVETVKEVAKQMYENHARDVPGVRRLRRKWSRDLLL